MTWPMLAAFRMDFLMMGAMVVNAFLVNDGDKDYWLPKKLTEDNGDGTFAILEWLAIEKGIV